MYNNTTGTNNTALGYGGDVSMGGLTNATAIGSGTVVLQSNTMKFGASLRSLEIERLQNLWFFI